MPISGETLTLAALLIAPGVIAVLLGITLGVVEQTIGRDRLYLTSFVSSIIIDVCFIWIVQNQGTAITERDKLESIFFGPDRFRVEAAVLLFLLSCMLGLVYALALRFNLAQLARSLLGKLTSHYRNPWQPWEGGLRDAEQVQVELANGEDMVGMLAEYSRVDNERQLVLKDPLYVGIEEESPRKKAIITEDEIRMVHVVTLQQREGLWTKFINAIQKGYKGIVSRIQSLGEAEPQE